MDDDGYDRALLAWCRYHVWVEAFDRSISNARSPRTGDAVIDRDPWIRWQSYANAREAQRHLASALHGVSDRDSQRAKEDVAGWSFERQCEFLDRAALKILNGGKR